MEVGSKTVERERAMSGIPAVIRRVAAGIVLLLAVATAVPGAVTETQRPRRVRLDTTVRSVRSGDFIDLVVENRKLHDITLTLRISPDSEAVQRLVPETATYAPNSRTVAARLPLPDPTKGPAPRYHFDWVKGSTQARHDPNAVYRLPFEPGKSHRVAQSYGGQVSHQEGDLYAVDFAMQEGTIVFAARDGLVVDLKESFEEGGPDEKYSDRFNFVSILHQDGTIGEYLHLQHDGVLVELGQQVTAGMPIARSGNTGYSTRPHLHFGVYSAVDGTHIRSHPITFVTRQGTITEPIQGTRYTAK